jgi:alpha-1,3-rhamnosyl/mannosyltransferase
VSRLGYVDAYERDDLLAGASVLAYPSLYEGFGFPPLEAMEVDVPVLAADIEPLREVLESAALFVDPLDVDAIGDGLRQILAGPDLRAELSRRGRERVAHHRWDLAAARFLECYEALASG